SEGFMAEFGEQRVVDAPLAESGIVGVAIGMALHGLLPVAEIEFADFIHPAFDQILSEASRMRYRTNGDWGCPVVIRAPCGGGIHAEVVDVRSLAPLDTETILASVRKTARAMVVYEDNRTYGAGAEIAATIAEQAMFDLDAPIVRIGGPDIPAMPFAGALEHYYMEPEPDHIFVAMRDLAHF